MVSRPEAIRVKPCESMLIAKLAARRKISVSPTLKAPTAEITNVKLLARAT